MLFNEHFVRYYLCTCQIKTYKEAQLHVRWIKSKMETKAFARCAISQGKLQLASIKAEKKHLPSLLFIDRDPYYYTRRVTEAIHIKPHPNNINRDSGIEIPEAWMPTIKKHNNRRALRQRTAEGANHSIFTYCKKLVSY